MIDKKKLWFYINSGSSADADYAALKAAGYVPLDQTKDLVFLDSLKTSGVWAKLDRIITPRLGSDAGSGLINWKDPTKVATRVASCTFTQGLGFKSNGSTMYIDTNYSPKLDGVQFQLNDCSMFGYVAEAYATPGVIYGANDSAASNQISLDPNTAGNAIFFMESTTFGDNLAGSTDAKGFWHSQRTAAGTSKLFKDGSLFGNGSRTSADRPTRTIWLLCRNNDGAINSICDSNVSIGIWGAGASLAGLESALRSAWNTRIS